MDSLPGRPRVCSIRRAHTITILPMTVFAGVILVSSALFVQWVSDRADAMAAAQAAGQLTELELRAAADGISTVWLSALGVFLVATAVGLWVSRRAHRMLVDRLEKIARYADSVTRGDPEEPPSVASQDALGALEQSLGELGRAVRSREQALRAQSAQRDFEGKLASAFKMANDEPRTLEIVRRGLAAVDDDLVAELLLADSSQSHLRRAVLSPAAVAGRPLCAVDTPSACPASTGGRRAIFADSRSLDACHHLYQGASDSRCAAACFPVAIAGRTVGVLHARFPDGTPPPEAVVDRLESIAHEAGTRLGVLRALNSSELAAATDPLTGLLNRRSLDQRFERLAASAETVSVLVADLDHFKRLNDTYGHPTGDRALRMFAQSLTASVRSEDIVARHGGEEFVLAFANAPVEAVVGIVQAIRAALVTRLGAQDLPSFTASFGAVVGVSGKPLSELLREADAALYEAKQAGRNRTVAVGHGVVEQGDASAELTSARLVVEQAMQGER